MSDIRLHLYASLAMWRAYITSNGPGVDSCFAKIYLAEFSHVSWVTVSGTGACHVIRWRIGKKKANPFSVTSRYDADHRLTVAAKTQ